MVVKERVRSVMTDFFKFPSTVHLAFLDDSSCRADKCMTQQEREAFLSHEIVVEEKIDGANLGISFDTDGVICCQNRGHRLVPPYDGQWRLLARWLDGRIDYLFDKLEGRLILFGEWCYARHSVPYDALPDWFVLFDVYDRNEEIFYSTCRRNQLAEELQISYVPEVGRARYKFEELAQWEFRSSFGETLSEGMYLRYENSDHLIARSKLVRPAFRQAIEKHWSRAPIHPNRCSVSMDNWAFV